MRSMKRLINLKTKVLSLLLLACMPLMTGCLAAPVAAAMYSGFLLLDIALIPVRSFIGGLALDFVNTF